MDKSAHSNAIRGVEIFRAGIHNGDSYTEQDINDMVSAFNELDFRPALKVGHTKDQPGAPAYGWVKNLKRVGDKLVADFEDMHDSVVDAIRKRTYPNVSAEIYFNLKRGGKSFRRALKAVALLGADVPAVAGLTPLHKMEFAADGFDSVAACEQTLDIQKQAIIDSLTERVAALTEAAETAALEREVEGLEDQVAEFGEGKWITVNGRHVFLKKGQSIEDAVKAGKTSLREPPSLPGSTPLSKEELGQEVERLNRVLERERDAGFPRSRLEQTKKQLAKAIERLNSTKQKEYDAMTIKELQEKKAALQAQLDEMKKKGGDEDKAKIAKFEQDIAEFGTQIASLQEAAATNEENQRLRAQVSLLMEKDRAREVTERVAKCKVIAFREDLEAIYTHALASPAVKVKHFAVKDGKRTESEKTITEVVDSLVGQINASSKKLFEVVTDGGVRRREEGPSGDDAGREIDEKAKARMRDGKSKDYAEAMEAVLSAEPELAERYNQQQAAGRQ